VPADARPEVDLSKLNWLMLPQPGYALQVATGQSSTGAFGFPEWQKAQLGATATGRR
jgi:hypothetical protein